jgi:hypothetical protein
LSDDLEDVSDVITVLLAQHSADALPWYVFQDQIEKTLLIEVLYNLDDVGVVQVFEDLCLLESSDEVHLLADCFYFAGPLQAGVSL